MASHAASRASLDRLSKALNRSDKPRDEHVWGTVESANADGSYQVRINASGDTTRCTACCTANVGDRVLVTILANGQCAAVGRLGGDLGGGGGGGGEPGATFFPSVSAEGVISWTNNGGYANPNPVDISGSDGISATHAWSGTTLTVTSASGTSSADLKGEKGDDYTLTEADKAEITSDVIKMLDSGAGASSVLGVGVLGTMVLASGGSSSSRLLPMVSEADNGKILTVVGGQWTAASLPVYSGSYSLTPTASGFSVPTAGAYMEQNMTVNPVPYSETSNNSGGTTIYVASEVES